MDTQVLHEVSVATQEGRMIFPEVVAKLMAVGVESYEVDFVAGRETFYHVDGTTYSEEMIVKIDPVAAEFDGSGLVAAIRGAQADTVRYPEFVKRSTAAGAIGYRAFLTGRKVLYLGRKGEQHVEEFQKA